MPPIFSRGDIVLTKFPFTDFSGTTVRPALVISPGLIGNDLILAGISSVVRGVLPATDCVVDTSHPEFAATGLRVTSVLRLHKLVTVEHTLVQRRLGCLGPQLLMEMNAKLRIATGT